MSLSFDTVGNLIQVRLFSYCRDQLAINVLHYRVQTPTTLVTTTDLHVVNGINNLFRDRMGDCMSRDAFYYGCDAQQIFPVLRPATHTTTPQRDGQTDAPALPIQTAGIVRKYTAFGGRRYRGRAYIPFPADTDVDVDHYPTADYLARVQLVANRIVGTGPVVVNGTDSFELAGIIYHRPDEEHPPVTQYTFIDSCVSIRKWAVQRKRGDYGRQNPLPW